MHKNLYAIVLLGYLSSYFSELAGVREHDLEVTDQARAAEENVSETV